MVSFPIFRSLTVDGYGLFPGEADSPGMQVNFSPGLTLFLGANGLGKTTTVTMLFRLLTGLQVWYRAPVCDRSPDRSLSQDAAWR